VSITNKEDKTCNLKGDIRSCSCFISEGGRRLLDSMFIDKEAESAIRSYDKGTAFRKWSPTPALDDHGGRDRHLGVADGRICPWRSVLASCLGS